MVAWRGDEVLEDDFPGDKLQREIETRWKCGKSQILAPENPLEYTGIEIREFKEEYHVSQMKYTKSLLATNGVLKNAKKSEVIFDSNECEQEAALEIMKEQYPKRETGYKGKGEEKMLVQEEEYDDMGDDENWMADE
jgi:hypothetical protein